MNRNSASSLVRTGRESWGGSLARLYNRLLHYYPELAGKVHSDAYTRNVLGNRVAAGDVRWLAAEGMLEWQPECIGWLVGWATSRATLESLIPFVERAAACFPGSAWSNSIPGQLALLDVAGLSALTDSLLRLGSTPPDEPGIVENLTTLHLVIGWRDGTEIPYLPARRIADQPPQDPEFVLFSHRRAIPRPEVNWQLLRLAVLGPQELRLEAADAWADDWLWRNAVLLGLDLMPAGPYLRKATYFSHEHCGRAIAWARRLGQAHWFDGECSASFLLEPETGPSTMTEALIRYCRYYGLLPKLRNFAAQWLVSPAHQRFKALL